MDRGWKVARFLGTGKLCSNGATLEVTPGLQSHSFYSKFSFEHPAKAKLKAGDSSKTGNGMMWEMRGAYLGRKCRTQGIPPWSSMGRDHNSHSPTLGLDLQLLTHKCPDGLYY